MLTKTTAAADGRARCWMWEEMAMMDGIWSGRGCGNQAGGRLENSVVRYARALGVAMILFGILAPGRFAFFWAGVVLMAVSGML